MTAGCDLSSVALSIASLYRLVKASTVTSAIFARRDWISCTRAMMLSFAFRRAALPRFRL